MRQLGLVSYQLPFSGFALRTPTKEACAKHPSSALRTPTKEPCSCSQRIEWPPEINTLAAILGSQIWCLFIACLSRRKEYSRAPFCVSLSPSLQGSQIWCLFIACLRKEYSRRGRRAAKNRIEQNGHKQAKSKFLFLTVTPRYLIQFL